MVPSFPDADTLRDPFTAFSRFFPTGLSSSPGLAHDSAALWPHGSSQAFADVQRLQLDLFEMMLALWLLPLKALHDEPDPEIAAVTRTAPPAPAVDIVVSPPVATSPDVPPLLAAESVGEPDDLQRIIGIGPKLRQTLNGLGIWRFQQIASLSPEQTAWLNDKIGFKGRIEREGWKAQASRLAKAARPAKAA